MKNTCSQRAVLRDCDSKPADNAVQISKLLHCGSSVEAATSLYVSVGHAIGQ